MTEISEQDFSVTDTVFQIGVAPRRIDILTEITAVNYDEAKTEAIHVDIDGLRVNVLSSRHLVQNKMNTGRPKDIDDVENLRKHFS